MSCECGSEVSVTVGCLNGSDSVLIHTQHIKDANGVITGVTTRYTDAAGNKLTLAPTDVVTPGACPMQITVPDSDWRLVYYYEPGSALPCRQVILRVDDSTPPIVSAFELDGTDVVGFNSMFIVDKCPCTPMTPEVVW